MKKIMLVFGTRPEAIKMCPLYLELKRTPGFTVVVCVTGQHREMLDQVLDAFQVVPDYDLNIMKQQQTLFDITTTILTRMQGILETEKPDVLLVHGDTTTAFASSLASYYMQIPVGHVEAGLRTYNVFSPYPEEFNRQAVGSLAAYHFAPTMTAKGNLVREGKAADRIYVTGNTALDALRTTVAATYTHPELERAGNRRIILLTAHRRESLGEPLSRMFRAIRRIVEAFPDTYVIYPIHKNPLVRAAAKEILDGCDRVRIIEPLSVIDFHNFMARSYVILTDSGGIQEEAPALHVPVLVMRDTTERPEGILAGTLRLVGTEEASIFQQASILLSNPDAYRAMQNATNPYGDGYASNRIAHILAGECVSDWSIAYESPHAME